jgi:L-threonylcarbamoyladenylate synthase
VLRLGGLSVEALSDVLSHPVEITAVAAGEVSGVTSSEAAGTSIDAVPAPGTLSSHYAPAARVEVVAADTVAARAAELLRRGLKVGLLAPQRLEGLPPGVDALPPGGGAAGYAQCLYQRLREADRRGLDVLLAVPPPATGIGAAVADRLRRAASTG